MESLINNIALIYPSVVRLEHIGGILPQGFRYGIIFLT